MQKLPQSKWEKWLDLDILVWLCEDGLCMRFLREGSSRHESSGRKKNEKKEQAGRVRERDGSQVQKGPTVFNIFTKNTRLMYST